MMDAYDAMSAAGVTDCRGSSALATATPSAPDLPPEQTDNWLSGPTVKARLRAAADASWLIYERRYRNIFLTWACDPFESDNGAIYRYAVISRAPCPGVGWVELCSATDHPTCPSVTRESTGACYDGADDHPEGAIEWAKASALKVKAHYHEGQDLIDERWVNILVGLGYSEWEAVEKAKLPMQPPSKPGLAGRLASVKVLWRAPDHMSLWGIPYRMRDEVGQTPNHLHKAHSEWRERRSWGSPFPGERNIDLSDWLWLGSPGWWGSWNSNDRALIEAWLAQPHVKACIPGNPGEWSYIDPAPAAATSSEGSDR